MLIRLFSLNQINLQRLHHSKFLLKIFLVRYQKKMISAWYQKDWLGVLVAKVKRVKNLQRQILSKFQNRKSFSSFKKKCKVKNHKRLQLTQYNSNSNSQQTNKIIHKPRLLQLYIIPITMKKPTKKTFRVDQHKG